MLKQKSFHLNPADADRKWFVVDAEGQTVGRLATRIASVLRGKHKPTFTPSTDGGDFVVVTNADKIVFKGNKMESKRYYWHTGYIGGIKERSVKEQLEKNPGQVITLAVKGMLPKNSLGRKQLTKLKVYAGAEHPHAAQNPEALKLN